MEEFDNYGIMKQILEDLKKYFRDTPRDQVLKDWAEAKKNAPKGGPKQKGI